MESKQTKKLPMEKLLPIMLGEFEQGKTFRMITNGTSMLPLIGNGCDTVILKKPADGGLKKYDIPLYRRADGSFVLHRVVRVTENGYALCGDNQTALETGITDKDVLAVACGVIKSGGRIYHLRGARYRIYCAALSAFRPARRCLSKIKRLITR